MKTRLIALALAAGFGIAISAQAKLPPAPPMDPAKSESPTMARGQERPVIK